MKAMHSNLTTKKPVATASSWLSYSHSKIYYNRRNTGYSRRSVNDTHLSQDKITYIHRSTPSATARITIRKADNRLRNTKPRRKLALLLPAHNEELIIATTIKSAVAAGQSRRDIYVVDDASNDDTKKIAIGILGKDHVLTVRRSGKALAVKKAIKKFSIESTYLWLHVADGDSVFSANYFRIFRNKLDSNRYAVAIGFVQSMRGNWISTYRSLCYTYGQHVQRRLQVWLRMVPVFPGPVTCFRTDILSKLEITGGSLTEDFDITLQVHRQRLGNVLFIPQAVNYTQDPQSLHDFCKQTMRWYRGFFQGVKTYRVGLHRQGVDLMLGFQMLQMLIFILQVSVLVPLVIIISHNWLIIPTAISIDFILTSAAAIFSAIITRRLWIVGALPYFYFLRMTEICMFVTAFVEIMILGRFTTSVKGWATEGRRYKLNAVALQDASK
jgi:cellulose synthase/poly-beta-1,6-N-acetylglucosamine synthase-like glycosyltransferase